ncbi:MAG: hypothetical protein JWR80_5642, partial [Bradyrhizobium sp.]|nr:hypothetical protein [Bradyrhizobium sp.]
VASPAAAAQMPREFHGVFASGNGAACKKADLKQHDRDDMISVEAQSISYHEGSCDFASVKPLGEGTADVALTCGGEGETWKSREVWSVQKVGSQKQLIAVSMSRSGEKNHKISVSVYVECP